MGKVKEYKGYWEIFVSRQKTLTQAIKEVNGHLVEIKRKTGRRLSYAGRTIRGLHVVVRYRDMGI